MGRPSKLKPDVVDRLCQAIRLGSTYDIACKYAGIHYDTFRSWIIKGEAAKSGKYAEFSDAIKKAEGDACYRWLSIIEEAANDGAWTAAAWKLERRYPQDWGRRSPAPIEGDIPTRVIVEMRDDFACDVVPSKDETDETDETDE